VKPAYNGKPRSWLTFCFLHLTHLPTNAYEDRHMTYLFMVHLKSQIRRIWLLHLMTNVGLVYIKCLFRGTHCLTSFSILYGIISYTRLCSMLHPFARHFYFSFIFCLVVLDKITGKIMFRQHNQLRWRRFIFLLSQDCMFFVRLFSLPIKIFCTFDVCLSVHRCICVEKKTN